MEDGVVEGYERLDELLEELSESGRTARSQPRSIHRSRPQSATLLSSVGDRLEQSDH